MNDGSKYNKYWKDFDMTRGKDEPMNKVRHALHGVLQGERQSIPRADLEPIAQSFENCETPILSRTGGTTMKNTARRFTF